MKTTKGIYDDLSNRYLVQIESLVETDASIPAWILAEPEYLLYFLLQYQETINADDLHTAASRWSYHMKQSTLYGALYALGKYNAGFDWSLSNTSYEHHPEEKKGYRWGNRLYDAGFEIDQDRNTLRKQVFESIFKFHFTPVFQALREVSRIGLRVLWENLVHVLVLTYPRWIEETKTVQRRQQFEQDYQYLQTVPGELFGVAGNPMKSHFETLLSRQEPSGHFVRQTCCLNYRIQSYCPECPVIASDRAKKIDRPVG